MAKKEGYYIASISGCSDPSVILYFDGKDMWSHGNATPLDHSTLLFVDCEPFNHRSVYSGSEQQDAEEWFQQAAKE